MKIQSTYSIIKSIKTVRNLCHLHSIITKKIITIFNYNIIYYGIYGNDMNITRTKVICITSQYTFDNANDIWIQEKK